MESVKNRRSRIEGIRRYTRVDHDGNELVYYTGLMPSNIAKQITFVPVMKDLAGQKSPLNEIGNGYQRPGSGSRMRQFSKYLSATPLAIVPPVLLSTRNKWTFIESEDADFGDLEISGPAAIIDGQHRMGGFIHLFESEDVQDLADKLKIILSNPQLRDQIGKAGFETVQNKYSLECYLKNVDKMFEMAFN